MKRMFLFLLLFLPALAFSDSGVSMASPALYSNAVRADMASTATGKGAALVGFSAAGTGAVASNVLKKLQERVSVADFGASPTASAAVNTAAINAAVAASSGVYFPAGVYATNGAILIGNTNCTLFADYPGAATIASTNASQDVIKFNRTTNNLNTSVVDINTTGGLNGIEINGGFVSKNSILENINITSPSNAGLLITGDNVTGSTFINGKVRNLVIQNSVGTSYGIRATGYNILNGTQFQNVTIISGLVGISVSETVSTTLTVKFDTVTIQAVQGVAVELDGIDALFTNLYLENNGISIDTADINVSSSSAAWPGHLTLINPYFGPQGAAHTTTSRIRLATTRNIVTIYGMANGGSNRIDGANNGAASNINLFGKAADLAVVNFNEQELRYGDSSISSYTTTLTGVDAVVTGVVKASRDGHTVTLVFPYMTGTSNALTKTYTGMPLHFAPLGYQIEGLAIFKDPAGANTVLPYLIDTAGVITIYSSTAMAQAWTSGAGWVGRTFTISYERF